MDRVSAKMRELSPQLALLQEVWLGSQVDRLTASLQPDWIPVCVKRPGRGPRGGLLAFVSAAAGWRVRSFGAFVAGVRGRSMGAWPARLAERAIQDSAPALEQTEALPASPLRWPRRQ